MLKKLLLLASGVILCTADEASAQFSLFFSSPLGLISKERVKLEYRLNDQNALLLSTAVYWGLCPGVQSYAEYRNYHFVTKKTEMFFYGKVGGGNGDEHGIDAGDSGPFSYFLSGGGMGYHFNMGKQQSFFMDLAFGLKYCQLVNVDPNGGNTQLFYITGPGSIVDINLHLGFKFNNKKTRKSGELNKAH